MTNIWQADFYRRPLVDADSQPIWELVICDASRQFTYGEFCPQSEAGAPWLINALEAACSRAGQWPDKIAVFRPQSLSLLEVACRSLPPEVIPQRDLTALKQWLRQRASWHTTLDTYQPDANQPGPYNPITLERPAPVPISEHLWGDTWQFAALQPQDLARLAQEPIPILNVPEAIMPVSVGLPSTQPIPGMVIDGGRQSMALAQWLLQANPVMLKYIAGKPDGLLLEAGLVDRWILTTFEDEQVAAAARRFTERKIAAAGLHFLLVRPDDSGMTYTGLWLLQSTLEKEILSPGQNP